MIFMKLLLAAAIWVSRNIEIKGLYMDDLYFWSCCGEQGFLQYVFLVGSTGFRFLYYLVAQLRTAVVGNHVNWFMPFNVLLSAAVPWSVYLAGRRLAGSEAIGFLYGLMYLPNRMAYYRIGQVLGLMKTMALWVAIGILRYLYRYMDEEDSQGCIYLSCALYFDVCFVHEQHMVLLPLPLFALLVKHSEGPWEQEISIGSSPLVQLIRAFTIGSVLPIDTGGTRVTDTFSIGGIIHCAPYQAAYMFGINAGPEHLNGCPWDQSPLGTRLLVLAADLAIIVPVISFLVKLIRDKRRDVRLRIIWNSVLSLLFTGACIASSSVIIRVEMCWVRVSLTASLLFLAYMYGVLTQGVKPELYLRHLRPWDVVFVCYMALILPAKPFCRGYYPRPHLWPNQLRYNPLAGEIYERCGDSTFRRTIYTIGNSYEMSDFTARTFFRVYDKDRTAERTRVGFIDNIRDAGLVNDRTLVLRGDPDHNGFQDITQLVKELELQIDYGYCEDGWMGGHASLTVMAGETGCIDLEIMYPGVTNGGEGIKATVDQEEPGVVPVRSTVVNTTIETEPWQMVHLTFDYNFYMPSAQKQRGGDKFVTIVHMMVR